MARTQLWFMRVLAASQEGWWWTTLTTGQHDFASSPQRRILKIAWLLPVSSYADRLYWVDLNTKGVESLDLDVYSHLEHKIHISGQNATFYDIATFQVWFTLVGT